MNIDLIRLKNNIDEYVYIDKLYSFASDLTKSNGLEELSDIHVTGYITKNCLDELEIDLTISGVMIILCAITLKPVEIPLDIKISGDLTEMLEEIDGNSKNQPNTIDILPIIWENILMEIPMKVISDDAKSIKTEGNGWKLITEEEKRINPKFDKLKDLL